MAMIRTNSKYYLQTAINTIPQDVPFIFWDTCALLDILRIPYREHDVKTKIEQYQKILDLIENGNLVSVTSDMVLYEFNSNHDDILRELNKNKDGVVENLSRYSLVINSKLKKKIESIVPLTKAKDCFVLLSLVRKIWKQTYIIREQDAFKRKAHTRTKLKQPPAKNKGEYKDCYIWSAFSMYANRSNSPLKVFITTNTADYCDTSVSKSKADPLLLRECSAINAEIHLNIGSLYGCLKNHFGF